MGQEPHQEDFSNDDLLGSFCTKHCIAETIEFKKCQAFRALLEILSSNQGSPPRFSQDEQAATLAPFLAVQRREMRSILW